MIQPDFVKAGEPIKASNINALVSAARSTRRATNSDPGNVGRRMRPFDVIDVNRDGADWLIRVQPGFYIQGSTASAIYAEDGEDLVPLTDFPDLTVEDAKNLYFKYSERKLLWETPEAAAPSDDLLLLVSFTIEENGLSFTNHHPGPVFAKVFAPFTVKAWVDGETVKASVAPGYVRGINPKKGAEAVKDWMPIVGEIPLDADTPPVFTVADGDWLYCKVETSDKGIINDTPTVFVDVAAKREDSEHYMPESPDGEIGLYYYPLASISVETVVDELVPKVKQIQSGTIWQYADLPELKNIGGQREVFKRLEKEEASYKFRTLHQLEGDGQEIIVPLGEEEEESDKDTIEFRRVHKGPKDQIQVVTEGNAILVKGNNFDYSGAGIRSFGINIYDGLVQGFNVEDDDTGWWGTAVWKFYSPGNPSVENEVRFTFEAGRLMQVEKKQSSGDYEIEPGTEEATGGVEYWAENVFS
jgi:hypothetical protein